MVLEIRHLRYSGGVGCPPRMTDIQCRLAVRSKGRKGSERSLSNSLRTFSRYVTLVLTVHVDGDAVDLQQTCIDWYQKRTQSTKTRGVRSLISGHGYPGLRGVVDLAMRTMKNKSRVKAGVMGLKEESRSSRRHGGIGEVQRRAHEGEAILFPICLRWRKLLPRRARENLDLLFEGLTFNVQRSIITDKYCNIHMMPVRTCRLH